MMTKEQVQNAKTMLKGVNGKIKEIDAIYGSLSNLLKDLRLDTELSIKAKAVCEKVGLKLSDLTPATIKAKLAPEQFQPTKVGKETMSLMCTYKDAQVYDEVEATLPDGSKKKVRVPQVKKGVKVTEIKAYPIKPGKWTADAFFTLMSQAAELSGK